MKNNRYIISLGGSLIVPGEIDIRFLREFKKIIEREVAKGKKFLIITGGGRTARRYAEAARNLRMLSRNDLDWLGVHSTRLNAHLLRTVFRKHAHARIITNPRKTERAVEPIIIAAGWRPGSSTDHQAVLLAKKYGIKNILNLTNIDYVYDKDPNKYKNAKAYKQISWHDFRKIVGNKWDPGSNTPFDPVASRVAAKLKLTVVILNGGRTNDLNNYLSGKSFKGTVIS
jgi:uridylate kinase